MGCRHLGKRTERDPKTSGRSRAQYNAGVEVLGYHHLFKKATGALLSHGPVSVSWV